MLCTVYIFIYFLIKLLDKPFSKHKTLEFTNQALFKVVISIYITIIHYYTGVVYLINISFWYNILALTLLAQVSYCFKSENLKHRNKD